MVNDLIPVYGERFLRYVLAFDGEEFSGDSLDKKRLEVAQSLREHAFSSLSDELGHCSHLASLNQWVECAQTSYLNALRLHCGGELPALREQNDSVLVSLQRVARDAWPGLLLRAPREGPSTFWNAMPLVAFDHPAGILAARAFLADEALGKLYPHGPDPESADRADLLSLSSWWVTGLGGMAHHELLPLIGLLVTGARLWGLVEHGADTWENLLDALPEALAATRRLALGETVEVPYLIGFRGASVDPELILDLSTGTLRAPRPVDCDFLLPGAKEVSLVTMSRYPLRLLGVRPKKNDDEIPDFSAAWSEFSEERARIERDIDLIRLAVLLASDEDQAWGLNQIASLVVDPTAAGGSAWGRPYEHDSRSATIDAEGSERIRSWHSTVERLMPDSLDISMRRALSAAGHRGDATDGFIDAIVAWENCFGTRQETSFRVTGGIAALLQPSPGQNRVALQKRLKKLYSKRSDIVHGSDYPSPTDAVTYRDEAIQVAIQCLRGLLEDRPDLLECESAVRGTELMLGSQAIGK